MASLRQIRQRLRSTQSTKQIMRAMQLVSASKLKRAQGKLLQARTVLQFLDGLLQRVLASMESPPRHTPEAHSRGARHPLCDRRPDGLPAPRSGERLLARQAGASALVLFTSDAGLCGSYNTNLIQLAEAHLSRDALKRTQIIYIGKKGHRYFTKRGYAAAEAYLDLAGRADLAKAEVIGRSLMEQFLSGDLASIQLLHSQCVSSAVYRPAILPWLPIQLTEPANPPTRQPANVLEYIFEPSPERVFEDLLPRWALAKFQLVMLEAFASEHSARMIAMKNATDNAEEILKGLTTQRNKIRQAMITTELSEIVGTAEALK